ncbi:MAG: aconitate hydratase [Planctomycetaceae bacterium]|jgi:aconitate hydratase|nr:aconitate hydratase [Planctomycetaceae bacterium]
MFDDLEILSVFGKEYGYYSLRKMGVDFTQLPYSIRVLLESALRNCDGEIITEDDVKNLMLWRGDAVSTAEVPFKPSRVLLQDFTGVPAVVDLAAMRSAMRRLGYDPELINPLVPVDLVIDHSVQTDFYGSADALSKNVSLEFMRNSERYSLLSWAQNSLSNFRVIPPSVGIIHQVNLEYLADVVHLRSDFEFSYKNSLPDSKVAFNQNGKSNGKGNSQFDRIVGLLYPDSVLGTDSHTVMINGLGVLGWGVGGIEAEAVMLGQPYYMVMPQVIGMNLSGKLRRGVTATDLVLTLTEFLRREGVVGKFIEYFGNGVESMPVTDRALLANMAPEYGATMGYFPVDAQTLDYLRATGRSAEQVEIVRTYCKEQFLYREASSAVPSYTKILSFNLDDVEPSLAGPKRPQDRVSLANMQLKFRNLLPAQVKDRGFGIPDGELRKSVSTNFGELRHGSVVIASITSCTNTSNPRLMIAAGLIARNAILRGLNVPKFVKTSLAPGSRVVMEYLIKSGLYEFLEGLGFHVAGFGCMSCIGNSGGLLPEVERAILDNKIVAAAVISGNRNFEGRINPLVRANYLASPPLVVAYAIAGNVDIDFEKEPIGTTKNGDPIFLRDILPDDDEITQVVNTSITPEMYNNCYKNVFTANENWNTIANKNNNDNKTTESNLNINSKIDGEVDGKVSGKVDDKFDNKFDDNVDSKVDNKVDDKVGGLFVTKNHSTNRSILFKWDNSSTYIQEPPFLFGMRLLCSEAAPEIFRARALVLLGDSVTTDHISPAGSIKADSPAGNFLRSLGVSECDFNSYGARRGNDKIMTRGTFANIRLQNLLAGGGIEGGVTRYLPNGELLTVYEAAAKYKENGVPLIVIAGNEYGTGSSRDWAAKGTLLLGVKAVIATGYERIHRGNLIGMGVLPLEFPQNVTWQSLNLTGEEEFTIPEIDKNFKPEGTIIITAEREVKKNIFSETKFQVKVRIDSPIELKYYLNGGIMQTVIRNIIEKK